MEPKHIFSLPLQANPNRLDPCVNVHFIAVPISKNVIGLWKTSEIHFNEGKSQPLAIELTGHSKEIHALALSSANKYYLASSCAEKVLLWDLYSLEQQPKHCQFFSNPGDLSVMCFSNNDSLIAAGKESCVVLFERGKSKFKAVLEAHTALISGVKFCPHYSATLVSISDDRSFCVWNVDNLTLLYHSPLISSAPLISLTMNLVEAHVSIGTADGNLRIFDLTDGHNFRQLVGLDLANVIRKYQEKHDQENSKDKSQPACVSRKTKILQAESVSKQGIGSVEASESLLCLEYLYTESQDLYHDSNLYQNFKGQYSGAGDLIRETSPSLTIISTNSIIHLNPRTFEVIGFYDLHWAMTTNSFLSTLTVGPLSYAISKQISPFQIIIIIGTIFDRKIHTLECTILDEKFKNLETKFSKTSDELTDEGAASSRDDYLNVVTTETILENSPLRSEMPPPVIKNVTTKGDIATGKKKNLSQMNQPLTFKSKIKSSGYTQAPRTTMFKPETSKNKLLGINEPPKKKTSKDSLGTMKMLQQDYDHTLGPVSELCNMFEVDNSSTAVLNLRFSDDGNNLACALSNKTALSIKAPYSKHVCTSFIRHNSQVNSVYWSYSNNYILTASNDKSVALWDKSGGDPLMILNHQKGSSKVKPETQTVASTASSLKSKNLNSIKGTSISTGTENKPFLKEIKSAQFFYMDKFILTLHGNELFLFKFYVTSEIDELKRYQSRNQYKLVKNWQSASSTFTTLSAVNFFYSHLVMCTTSGKTIEIYDLNKGVLRHVFSDCHTRPPHCLIINEGSGFSSQPSLAYNVIATAAPTDPIKLWDLRSQSCIQALTGHKNGSHACQIAFSPCGNYLASGSEDRCVYLFDLRKGTFCEKLKGHSEIVSSVAFHPAYPLLATGSLDSKIIWYKPK